MLLLRFVSAALGLALVGISADYNRFDVNRQDGPLYPIKVDGKYGYINSRGKVIVAPRFTRASRFNEGLALVFEGETAGYVDIAGHLHIKLIYKGGGDFSEGYAAVRSGDMVGFFLLAVITPAGRRTHTWGPVWDIWIKRGTG